MPRRKQTILDDLAVLPWWYSPLAALAAYLFFSYLIPSLVPADRPAFAGLKSAIPMLAPVVSLVLLVPMPFAYLNGRKKRRLIDANEDLDTIRALSWRDFEHLVAEAYRRRGYTVRENLTSGSDGGVDVMLERDGQFHLVQCKQWKARKVGVGTVREMFGVMVDQSAASVSIVTSGVFTQEAQNFAEDKAIDLVDGAQLNEMIAGVRRPGAIESPVRAPAVCPECGSDLVERMARKGANAGKAFLGCAGFPQCRYTRDRYEN